MKVGSWLLYVHIQMTTWVDDSPRTDVQKRFYELDSHVVKKGAFKVESRKTSMQCHAICPRRDGNVSTRLQTPVEAASKPRCNSICRSSPYSFSFMNFTKAFLCTSPA